MSYQYIPTFEQGLLLSYVDRFNLYHLLYVGLLKLAQPFIIVTNCLHIYVFGFMVKCVRKQELFLELGQRNPAPNVM
jgi:hypothetical protein